MELDYIGNDLALLIALLGLGIGLVIYLYKRR